MHSLAPTDVERLMFGAGQAAALRKWGQDLSNPGAF